MRKKKFITIIWGYHKQIFSFPKKQNYHMLPLDAMKEIGYECEIFAIDSQVRIEDDPNFTEGTKVLYYSSFIGYIMYLWKNRKCIIYSNSLTLKTLLAGIIGRKTVFYPHAYIFGGTSIKRKIIAFFYHFFTKIRVNNFQEKIEIDRIRKNLGVIIPLSIDSFYYTDNISEDLNHGVFIGNLTDIKNPLFLLDAIEILSKKRENFLIYFIGEDRMNFLKEVKRRNLDNFCCLLGYKTPVEIKKVFGKSNFFINTSRSEGQCIAAYEAILAGKKLLLPDSISFNSVFGKTALFHKTTEELAGNIEKAILEPYDKSQITIMQDKILQQYSYGSIKKQLQELFLSL